MKYFTEEEKQELILQGRNVEKIEQQFGYFEKGFKRAYLLRPARVSDGIIRLTDKEIQKLEILYEENRESIKPVKFVPASGAASRMFKPLFDILSNQDEVKGKEFLSQLQQFAFYSDLKQALHQQGISLSELIKRGNYQYIISFLLYSEGLNYSNLPKGLIPFHSYENGSRTAAEEHLVEAALYASDKDGICRVHFTVSYNHLTDFQQKMEKMKPEYEKMFGVKYELSYSIQNPLTDTLAATLDNHPFKDKRGKFLFRPGGHGALIDNLNQIHSSMIFIKNIDNVTRSNHLHTIILYKKLLAALMFKFRKRIQTFIQHLDDFTAIEHFLKEDLRMNIPTITDRKTAEYYLNRPLRVCGMVKNEGELGGGPFWVKNEKIGKNEDIATLQIVETSQIDMENEQQKDIFQQSTHFNPVDMVCSTLDVNGNPFDLSNFIDIESGFIAEKSYEGKQLKAMELPGLWNGAMAKWLTIFVEIPLETFHPAKTIYDLKNRI